jgi:anti-sigma B factor antagonist
MSRFASPRSQPLSIEIRDAGNGVRHLVLAGELDLAAAPALERSLVQAPADSDCLVVDMSALTFLDSTGVHFLVQLNTAAERDGWLLRLVPGPPEVQRVLEIIGVADLLPFIEDGAAPQSAPERRAMRARQDSNAREGEASVREDERRGAPARA